MCIRDSAPGVYLVTVTGASGCTAQTLVVVSEDITPPTANACLLYTSDAADERSSVDLGGRRIIKKKNYKNVGVVCIYYQQIHMRVRNNTYNHENRTRRDRK